MNSFFQFLVFQDWANTAPVVAAAPNPPGEAQTARVACMALVRSRAKVVAVLVTAEELTIGAETSCREEDALAVFRASHFCLPTLVPARC